jgi:hypothetical protein
VGHNLPEREFDISEKLNTTMDEVSLFVWCLSGLDHCIPARISKGQAVHVRLLGQWPSLVCFCSLIIYGPLGRGVLEVPGWLGDPLHLWEPLAAFGYPECHGTHLPMSQLFNHSMHTECPNFACCCN